jgi:hypothetical protein
MQLGRSSSQHPRANNGGRGSATWHLPPQAKCTLPSIDLTQSILLPLLQAAVTEDLHYVDEVAHTCRPEASLAGDGESRCTAYFIENP